MKVSGGWLSEDLGEYFWVRFDPPASVGSGVHLNEFRRGSVNNEGMEATVWAIGNVGEEGGVCSGAGFPRTRH